MVLGTVFVGLVGVVGLCYVVIHAPIRGQAA
jgi:hypothetical protein